MTKPSVFPSGGDDYLAKPFSYAELVSRAKALIRRYQIYQGKPDQPAQHSKITYHQLTLDERTQEVTKYGVPMELTDTEYSILLLLLTHPGQIFPTSISTNPSGMSRIITGRTTSLWCISEICAEKLKMIQKIQH